MNKPILIGRLTKDPELKTTASGVSVCSFSLAVNRRFKNADGEYDTDFIGCVAWKQQAEFLYKHFSKGSQVGIIGNIQTHNYDDKEGRKIYITEVIADEIYFVGDKKKTEPEYPEYPPLIPPSAGFAEIEAAPEDDLLF